MHAYEKVFICAGKYHLVGPIDLSKTCEIVAEPGTEIILDLKDSKDALFMAGDSPSEVANLTLQMSYPTRRDWSKTWFWIKGVGVDSIWREYGSLIITPSGDSK